jgi:serine/threonine-protein kinase
VLAGTPPGTRPATVAATAPATAASIAAEQLHDDTVLSAPPTALLPPGARPEPMIAIPDVTGEHPRTSHRRIAIVAIAAAAAGVAAMLYLFSTASSDADTAGAPPPDPAPPPAAAADAAAAAARPPVATADAAPAEVEPMTAELYVVTEPAEAAVSLGPGRPTGTSPARFTDLPPGTVHVRVVLDGYEPVERDVPLAPGERRTLELPMAKIPPPVAPPSARPPPRATHGLLTVRTTPYSEVWLGSRRLGVTPAAGIKLPPGTHTLTFKHPGRKPHRRTVTIRSNHTTKLNFPLP